LQNSDKEKEMEHKQRGCYNAFARRKQTTPGIAAAIKSSIFIGSLVLAREDDHKLEWRKLIRQLRFYRSKFDSTQQLSENFTRLESNNFLTSDIMCYVFCTKFIQNSLLFLLIAMFWLKIGK
jgi:hypothetical protein